MLKCESCDFESELLDEVCYYDINGYSYCEENDIERNCQNLDALAHVLCNDCSETFEFSK